MSDMPDGPDMDRLDEDRVQSNGWSITVGELRAALEGVPDDYEVMLCNAEVDDIDISNVNIEYLYPPSATGSVGLLVLGGGQVVTSEYDYDVRMDAHHAVGGDSRWRGPNSRGLTPRWVRSGEDYHEE